MSTNTSDDENTCLLDRMQHVHIRQCQCQGARSWRRWWEPQWIEYREREFADAVEREVRRRIRETSHDIAGAARWSVAVGPSYKELERRRQLVSELPCGVCGVPVTWVHPIPDEYAALLPDVSWSRCADHAGQRNLVVAA